MRKLKWFVCMMFLGCLLLLVVGKVEAQCTGYTITGTSVNFLSPTDAAAQGQVTGTIITRANNGDGSPVPGAMASHNLTVTPGTWIGFGVSSNHGVSSADYYTVDNNSSRNSQSNMGLSGSFPTWWLMGTEHVGHTYHMFYVVTDANGNTTSDRVNVTVVAGIGPSFTSQDGLPTNAYYQLVSTFGGGSMMNNCSECQGGETQPCLQATHTPSFDSTITNPATGETHTLSNISAGNVAKATESVSGTAYTTPVSFLPGDSPTGSTTNKIYCTMFGYVLAEQWNPGIPETEFAITAEEIIPSSCTLVLRFFGEMGDGWGVDCKVAWKKPPATADRCSTASQIPDFNPDTIWDEQHCKVVGNCGTDDLPPPNGKNTSFPTYWYLASRGIRFGGPPVPDTGLIVNGGAHDWLFPVYVAQGFVPVGPDSNWWTIFLNLGIPKGTGLPIDCTNKDKGTSPIPVPF